MEVHKLGQAPHTLNIEHMANKTRRESYIYIVQPRLLSPVQLVVPNEPGIVPRV